MQHEYSVLVERLRETLARLRYNPVVLHNYCWNSDSFLSYLAERKIALEALAERKIALEAVTPTEVSHYLRLPVRRFRKRHGPISPPVAGPSTMPPACPHSYFVRPFVCAGAQCKMKTKIMDAEPKPRRFIRIGRLK